jgi:hypothetical protein
MIAPGGLANIESAAMCVYNGALDVHAAFWRLTRAQLTFVMSAIGLAAAYITLIPFNAIESIEAFATLMLVTVTPWMVIMTIGHLMRHGWYEPMDLQAFADRAKTGVYWFTGGVNVKAGAVLPQASSQPPSPSRASERGPPSSNRRGEGFELRRAEQRAHAPARSAVGARLVELDCGARC